jgi:hypothetical protein
MEIKNKKQRAVFQKPWRYVVPKKRKIPRGYIVEFEFII